MDINKPLIQENARYKTGWPHRTPGDVLADVSRDTHDEGGRLDRVEKKLDQVLARLAQIAP